MQCHTQSQASQEILRLLRNNRANKTCASYFSHKSLYLRRRQSRNRDSQRVIEIFLRRRRNNASPIIEVHKYTLCQRKRAEIYSVYLSPELRNNLSEVCKLKSSAWVLDRESWIVCLDPWSRGGDERARSRRGLVERLNLRNEWLPRATWLVRVLNYLFVISG